MHRFPRIGRFLPIILAIELVVALLLPLPTPVLRAAQQLVALSPGDELRVTCETTLSGVIEGTQASLSCAAQPPATPISSTPAPPTPIPPTLIPPTPVPPTPVPSGGPAVSELRGVREGQALKGTVVIEALVSGQSIKEVIFDLAGPTPARHIERQGRYFFKGDSNNVPWGWNTVQSKNGAYTMTVTVTDSAGQRSRTQVSFTIANGR